MRTTATPGGATKDAGATPAVACFMNSVQIGSAACPPVNCSGRLWSKPTHTTTSKSGVKPTNHASP